MPHGSCWFRLQARKEAEIRHSWTFLRSLLSDYRFFTSEWLSNILTAGFRGSDTCTLLHVRLLVFKLMEKKIILAQVGHARKQEPGTCLTALSSAWSSFLSVRLLHVPVKDPCFILRGMNSKSSHTILSLLVVITTCRCNMSCRVNTVYKPFACLFFSYLQIEVKNACLDYAARWFRSENVKRS